MLSSLAVVRDAPKPITEVRRGASRELQRIIDRCLEKDPERRLQSASELRGLLGALALPSARPAARRMPVAVAAVIVIGLIAAALLLTRTRDRDAGNLPRPTFTRVTFEPRIES